MFHVLQNQWKQQDWHKVVRLQGVTTVLLNIQVFWDIAPYHRVNGSQRF